MSRSLSHGRSLDEIPEEVAKPFFVTTGLEGDTTRRVEPDHPIWARVAYAHRRQDQWDVHAHAAFWTALLPELRHRGRPKRADMLSRAAAALHEDGLDRAAIAEVLGIERNTIRVGERYSRPSVERGLGLLHEAQQGDQGKALRRLTGSGWSPDEALPRVEDSPDPPSGHFNQHIEYDWAPAGVDYAVAAENELRRRWEVRHRLAFNDGGSRSCRLP